MREPEYTCQCCMEVYSWFGAGSLFGDTWLCLHCQPDDAAEVEADYWCDECRSKPAE